MPSSEPFVEYNHINTVASATGEIIYDLIIEMDWPLRERNGRSDFCGNNH